MDYEVLSPRGDVDPIKQIGLSPRVTDLNKATIGLCAYHKQHYVLVLEEIAKQLQQRYPGARFERFQYTKDPSWSNEVAELAKDPEVGPRFEEWLKGVDTVLWSNGDAGSCALYLAYNATLAEHLGKPTAITVAPDYTVIARRGAELRGVPALRVVNIRLLDLAEEADLKRFIEVVIPELVAEVIDDVVAALPRPLSPEEAAVPVQPQNTPRVVMKGTLREVDKYFYRRKWAYGMPVVPPTEEAVEEMLTGTDLPRDHVVATIPPLRGKATVEKIAVNAVMAGCLPTHLPVVIAGVEALLSPRFWLEGYSCSMASWAPLMVVNGPVRKDLALTGGVTLFSPYKRGNAGIAHALGLVIMNLGGCRAGLEDMATVGHEGRFGMCIAENEEESPWEPVHVRNGFAREDSTITLAWPNSRLFFTLPADPGLALKVICERLATFGFDPGCTIVLSPFMAKVFQAHGLSSKDMVDYFVEYARRPGTEINVRWMKGHHHEPLNVPLPLDPTRSVRKFWSDAHLWLVVAGGNAPSAALYGGGGDHGGPISAKIRLPDNWSALVDRYKDYEESWGG